MRKPQILLKSFVFTILVPGTVAILIPHLLAKWRPHPQLPLPPRISRLIGNGAMILGLLTYVHTTIQFGKEGNGTPSPTDEPDELVTGGLYSFSRNPMYIGVLLFIFGQAIRYRSIVMFWWGIGMWIGFHNRVVGFEEPHLREKHGEAFEQYQTSVPRWLFR